MLKFVVDRSGVPYFFFCFLCTAKQQHQQHRTNGSIMLNRIKLWPVFFCFQLLIENLQLPIENVAQLKEQVLWLDGHGAAAIIEVILSKSHYHILNMPVKFAIDAVISLACWSFAHEFHVDNRSGGQEISNMFLHP